MAKHVNDGKCAKCLELLVGVEDSLVKWFQEVQARNSDAHVAWGRRGKKDQEDAYKRGTSKAQWGQSPHNYSPALAIDLFRLTNTGANWDPEWFRSIIAPQVVIAPGLMWGGNFAKFKDLPHIELKDWKDRVQKGIAKLTDIP